MPQLSFSQALTANQLNFNPISGAGWQYEFLPWPARCILLVNSTDSAERVTVYSGSETIQERSPVSANGVAGQLPAELSTPAIAWNGAVRDRIKIVIDNTGAGTPTVNGLIIVNPLV